MELGEVSIPSSQVPYYPWELKEFTYQDIDQRMKVHYFLNGIRCYKMPTAVAAVKAHPERYKMDFVAVDA